MPKQRGRPDAEPQLVEGEGLDGIPTGPESEEPIVIGVREIIRFTGTSDSGSRASSGRILRLLD